MVRSWTGSRLTTTLAGLKTLVRRLLKAGVDEVGIERSDGPAVDALIQAGLTVLVIPPGQLKNLRSSRFSMDWHQIGVRRLCHPDCRTKVEGPAVAACCFAHLGALVVVANHSHHRTGEA